MAVAAGATGAHVGAFVAEGVEAIGKGYQAVGVECVVLHILNVVTRDGTAYAVALTQNVIYFQGDGGILPFEELVGSLGVPQPALGVVAGRITGRTAVCQVGAQRNRPGQVSAQIEGPAVVVGTLVFLVLHAVGGQQVSVVTP